MSNIDQNIVDIAARGIDLSREIAKLEKELDKIKSEIREHAEIESGSSGDKVEIETPQGVVSVSFRPDRQYIKAGDSNKVQNLQIPKPAWEAIFEEKISYALQKDWALAATALDEEEEDLVREVISTTTYSPSVRFPK